MGDEGKSEQGPTGVVRPEGPEKKSFFERNKARIRLMAAAGILGAAAAGVSGHPEVGLGGGFEVTNPFTGENQHVGIILATKDDARAAGVPDSMMEDKNLRDWKTFKVKIGSASFSVWTAVKETKLGEPTIAVFTAADVGK